MQKKLTLILILILVLAQLCACGKPQAEPSPAAESEAAAPAELPEEEAPDEPDEPAGRTPDRVLTSTKYTAEVYIKTTQYGQYQIESREYAVSDGVSAAGLRAAGRGSYIRFFDQTVTEAGTVWYYDKSAGDWRSQALGDGCMPRRSSSWSWPPGRRIFSRCRARCPVRKRLTGAFSGLGRHSAHHEAA